MQGWDLILWNIRLWKIHFQVLRFWKISPMFAWYDFWIGAYIDQKKELTWYVFPLPMVGVKVSGIGFKWNSKYNFKTDPFFWVFQTPKRYRPMRNYKV